MEKFSVHFTTGPTFIEPKVEYLSEVMATTHKRAKKLILDKYPSAEITYCELTDAEEKIVYCVSL